MKQGTVKQRNQETDNLWRQVKNQHFSALTASQLQLGFLQQQRCVALSQRLAIHLQPAADQLHIGFARWV